MIYLDENGITIIADRTAKIGKYYSLSGEQYLVVDNSTLWDMVHNGDDVSNVVTTRVTNMAKLFNPDYHSNLENLSPNIKSWDVSRVKTMNGMFEDNEEFNQDISNWKVSKVKNMSYMFFGAISFNQPIGVWDVSSVTHMKSMFCGANNFNQNLSNWNVEKVESMSEMFMDAESFDSPIDSWNMECVFSTKSMFANAKSFNQDISNWNVERVEYMTEMFINAKNFNKPINNWKLKRLKNMDRMFKGASSFNQDLSNWEKSDSLKKPSGVFVGASNFDDSNAPFNLRIVKKNNTTKSVAKEPKTKKQMMKNIISNFKEAQEQESAGSIIVNGFRRLATANQTAPTSKTSDQEIIDIYQQVGSAFHEASKERNENLPAEIISTIAFKFFLVYEMFGEVGYRQHLKYEVDNYINEGLRDDYKTNYFDL